MYYKKVPYNSRAQRQFIVFMKQTRSVRHAKKATALGRFKTFAELRGSVGIIADTSLQQVADIGETTIREHPELNAFSGLLQVSYQLAQDPIVQRSVNDSLQRALSNNESLIPPIQDTLPSSTITPLESEHLEEEEYLGTSSHNISLFAFPRWSGRVGPQLFGLSLLSRFSAQPKQKRIVEEVEMPKECDSIKDKRNENTYGNYGSVGRVPVETNNPTTLNQALTLLTVTVLAGKKMIQDFFTSFPVWVTQKVKELIISALTVVRSLFSTPTYA
eukprot:TRINITY_DN1803_c0_g1_i1.p1 TRINITY_DN1803_c0_g1~~TRINITY_DN1803_c0_g1_i1.p1  ORF type:complete len:274 (+),score=46.20 TRINITY_DN1803_c0_g1_i1:423-1244(+)